MLIITVSLIVTLILRYALNIKIKALLKKIILNKNQLINIINENVKN